MPKNKIPNPEIEVEETEEIENEVVEPEPEVPKTPKKVVRRRAPDPDLGSDDETIEIKKPPKPTPMRKRQPKPKDPDAPKRERTPAQIAAWERCCAARKAREAERYALREKEMEDIKKYKDSLAKKQTRNVIKKAVNVKKKYAVVDEVLDDISDGEDIPIEVVKHAIKQRRARAQTAQPRQPRQPQPSTEYYEEDFVPPRPILRFV